MDQDKVFREVATLVDSITELLNIRIKNLRPVDESRYSNELHAKKAIALFLIRILNRYNRTLIHISKCILADDVELHYFTLPHIRTITDIYAKILYLAGCENDDFRALTCISYQAYAVSKTDDNNLLKEILDLNKEYLVDHEFFIPDNVNKMWSWYKDKKFKYNFSSNNIILKPEIMSKYAIQTEQVFKANDWYPIYSHISEILHGNPYYPDKPTNERYWISIMSLSTSAHTLELIDRVFLGKSYPSDYRKWLKLAKDLQPGIISQWLKA